MRGTDRPEAAKAPPVEPTPPASGMIDLHCHILPGIDDGAADLAVALDMARMALADGITTLACTPHVLPGRYENTRAGILAAIARLREALAEADIALDLVAGGDVHLAPDLPLHFAQGTLSLLGDSHYVLLEPPHHVLSPGLEETVRALLAAGCVPIITHPERLSWVPSHYGTIARLSEMGAPMQVTAGSLTGAFGSGVKALAERMLEDGLVDIIASDAHNTGSRPPILSRARGIIARRLGDDEADNLVRDRPAAVLYGRPLPGRPAGQVRKAGERPDTRRKGLRALLSRFLG